MINEYKEKYLRGEIPQNSYDDCRYAKNKVQYAKDWLTKIKGRDIDFDHPRNIVDEICADKIKLITADPHTLYQKVCWADKIHVYDMLKEYNNVTSDSTLCVLPVPCVCAKYTKTFDLKDLKGLQEGKKYIIKTNHGSGWNLKYIPGVSDPQKTKEQIDKWLSLNYAYVSGYELQYKWILPGYLIQELLTDEILDWSFWCLNGKIKYIGLTRKLGKNFEEYVAFTDENGQKADYIIGTPPEMFVLNKAQLNAVNSMKTFVHYVANKFHFVRVDMYRVNGKNYFGETTFTPCSGILDYVPNT